MKLVPISSAGGAGICARLTVPVLAFGGILMAVTQTVVVPLLPDLPRLTGSSPGAVSWLVTATLLAGAVLTPVLGRAGDMYGKRRVLLAALGLLAGALVVLSVWCGQQLRSGQPLVDLRLAAGRRVALPHVAALLAGFAFYANSLVTAQLVQAPVAAGYGLGLSIVATGLCLLPNGVIMLVLSPVSARVSTAYGARVTLAVGTAVMALGYVVRIVDSRHLWVILLGAAVVSMGTTFAYSALPTLILRAVPLAQTASASGVNVLMRTIGQSLCSAAVAAVLVRHTTVLDGVHVPTLPAYQLAFAMAGIIALAACAVALAIPSDPSPDGTERTAGRPGPLQETALEGRS
ncbi:MFS transporter [Streptomyces sp. NPDC088360]|uniref:MFS transporter n=1 Tax=Streptomyces sp. NPDC088360 TaxID=3154515 RepID=UPI003450C83B